MSQSPLSKDYMDMSFIPFSPQDTSSTVSLDNDISFRLISIEDLEEVINYNEKVDSDLVRTLEALQNITGYLEESSNALEGIDLTANKIYKIIERDNPSIMKTLKAYNLPTSISKIILTRVIALALLYGCQMPLINDND